MPIKGKKNGPKGNKKTDQDEYGRISDKRGRYYH